MFVFIEIYRFKNIHLLQVSRISDILPCLVEYIEERLSSETSSSNIISLISAANTIIKVRDLEVVQIRLDKDYLLHDSIEVRLCIVLSLSIYIWELCNYIKPSRVSYSGLLPAFRASREKVVLKFKWSITFFDQNAASSDRF